MLSEARQKKIMEKLNKAQKCSILGPQNLGSRGGPGSPGLPGSAPVIIVSITSFPANSTESSMDLISFSILLASSPMDSIFSLTDTVNNAVNNYKQVVFFAGFYSL